MPSGKYKRIRKACNW